VKRIDTGAVQMAALDGAGYCWIVLFNEDHATGYPTGPKYAGHGSGTATKTPATACKGTTAVATANWKTNWTKITLAT
jgi:hypothetical protein